jgi:hypothetical protein
MMATLRQDNQRQMAFWKRLTAAGITCGFFAAAVFLVAVLWGSSSAAPATTGGEASLLLTLDRPLPSFHPSAAEQLGLTEEEAGQTASADLVTELNDWTFTKENHGKNQNQGSSQGHGKHVRPKPQAHTASGVHHHP